MDKLQEAYNIVMDNTGGYIRPSVLADMMEIRKDHARGLLRSLVWLGVLLREDTAAFGARYRLVKLSGSRA